MSKEVDDRVVEMRFDNKNFESNVKTSMSTIDKLKQSLNFKGAVQGLDEVNNSSKKINFDVLSSGIESVKVQFSALQVIAVTALSNITTAAMNAGKNLMSSLTVDPIKTGFQEYETQINAVQTILANTNAKGTTLEDVNAALDELNTYADKTIYNFTEMTKNIGTFTAAGVDLQTSVGAIQGIANLAAISGSNAQQAATAMYQLSQALSSGTVKLMDWNSVVNAGMGGEVFQTALKETARLHGVAIDQMIEDEGSFRETLQNGWLTADVLTETLKKFTKSGVNEYLAKNSDLSAEAIQKLREQTTNYDDLAAAIAKKSSLSKEEISTLIKLSDTAEDAATKVKTFTQLMDTMKEAVQSGWTRTWELIIGDFEEAKSLFTNLSNTFGAIISTGAEARNSLLEGALNVHTVTAEDWDSILKSGVGIKDFKQALIDVAETHGIAIKQMIEDEGSFRGTLKNGWLSLDILTEALAKSESATDTSTSNISSKLLKFKELANEVIDGKWGNGEDRKKALTEAGHDYAAIQETVNSILSGTAVALDKVSVAELKAMHMTDEQITKFQELAKTAKETGTPLNELIANMEKPSGRELLIESFTNALSGIVSVLNSISSAWKETFSISPDELYALIEGLNNFSKYLVVSEKDSAKLKSTFKGLFAILDIFATLTGGALKVAIKIFAKLIGTSNVSVLDLTASVGDSIVAFRDWLFANNAVAEGIDYVVEKIQNGIDAFSKWIDTFMQLETTKDAIEQFKTAFTNTMLDFDDYFSKGLTKIQEFIERVKSMDGLTIDNVKIAFKDFRDNVLSYFLDVDGKFDSLSKAIEKFKDSVDKYLESTNSNFSKAAEVVSNFAAIVKDKLSGIGLGEVLTVGVGASLIITIGKVATALKKFSALLFDFSGSINGILTSISKAVKAYAFKTTADGILKIAIAIAVIAGALALLTVLDQDKLYSSLGALGLLALGLAALAGIAGALGTFAGFDKISSVVLTLSTSLLVLTFALKEMEKLDEDRLWGDAGILAVLALGLTGFAAVLSKAAPKLSSGSIFMLSFAGSLYLMVVALKKLQEIEIKDMDSTLELLSSIIAGMAVLGIAIGGLTWGSAASVIGISISLLLMSKAFEEISKINLDEAKKNIKSFITIFGMFAILITVSKFAGANAAKAGVMLLTMSVALNLMIIAIKMIAGVKPLDFDRALAGVAKLLLVFGLVVVASNFAGKHAAKAGAMLMMMAGALLIMSMVIVILSHIDEAGLARAIAAITTLELCFAGLIAVTLLANEVKGLKGTLIVLTVALGLMAIALGTLSMIDSKDLIAASASLAVVMGMFTLLIAVGTAAKSSIPVILVMGLVVAELALILYALSSLPVENVLGSATAISILLLSLSASLLVMAAVGAVAGPAIIGIALLEAFIISLGLLFISIGALITYFPELEEFIDVGLPLLQKIGDGLGKFFGSIVNGFLSIATDSFGKIGTDLGKFMTNAKPFFDGVKTIDKDSANGAKALAQTIFILTASNLITSLTSFLTKKDSLTEFANQLAEIGPAIATYARCTANIDGAQVKSSANAAKALAEFASGIPNEGGFLKAIVGDNTLFKFAQALALFGPEFAHYATSVKSINGSDVTASANAAKTLAEFASSIANEGGFISYIVGDNNLLKFGQALAAFGPYFATYAQSISSVKSSAIQASSAAAMSIVEFASSIANSGGFLKSIVGDNTLDVFGTQMVSFAESLVKYSATAKDIEINDIGKSMYAAKAITTLAETLPNSGGFVSAFSGDNDLGEFGEKLFTFGLYFKEYYDALANINVEKLAAVNSEIANTVLIANGMSLATANGLTSFGTSLLAISKQGLDGFISAFTDSGARINSTVAQFINYFVSAVKQHKLNLTTSFSLAIQDVISEIRSRYKDFYNAGAFVVDGFVVGISANTFKAEAASRAMANASLEAARKALDERSPSKAMEQIGDYGGQGFVIGMINNVKSAYNSGTTVANSMLSGVTNAISKISDVINGNLDTAPTICPVLDLSNIESGSSTISAMLSTNKAISVSSTLAKASTEIQNETPTTADTGTTFQFTQNNYSPKALSRLEIYRNTKNQFSALKEVIV